MKNRYSLSIVMPALNEENNIQNAIVHKGDAEILAGKEFHTILANINKKNTLARHFSNVLSLQTNAPLQPCIHVLKSIHFFNVSRI